MTNELSHQLHSPVMHSNEQVIVFDEKDTTLLRKQQPQRNEVHEQIENEEDQKLGNGTTNEEQQEEIESNNIEEENECEVEQEDDDAPTATSRLTARFSNWRLSSEEAKNKFQSVLWKSDTTLLRAKLSDSVQRLARYNSKTVVSKTVAKPLPQNTYEMLLGRGMLGVNLKPTFLPNNGVFVDFLVPNHTADLSGVVQIGDVVLDVGGTNVEKGTVHSVPNVIANANPRPVPLTFGLYGVVSEGIPIFHIDVLIALVYRMQPEYEEIEQPDGQDTEDEEEQDETASAKVDEKQSPTEQWPSLSGIIDTADLLKLKPAEPVPLNYVHQRIRDFELDDTEIHVALRNALFETIFDGRRSNYFAQFLEQHDDYKYLLLAREILEFFEHYNMKQRPQKIYHTYLAPTALLDCHGVCADSELRKIESLLDNPNAKMYDNYFMAAIEQLELSFHEFCQSYDCARMRAFLRGTKPCIKIPFAEVLNDPVKFSFALVHAMTVSAAGDLCDNHQSYISKQHFAQFRTSVYHEYMLQGMPISKLLRVAEFPPHVSVHKPIHDEPTPATTATTTGVAEALLLLRGESSEQTTRILCESFHTDIDLEIPLQVEDYAWNPTSLSLVDFCVPRAETGDSLYGVSLSVETESGDMITLALLSTRNTIVTMRQTLQSFYETHKTLEMEELKEKLVDTLNDVESELSKEGACYPEDLFLTRSGELLLKSLTPIPLALVFLATLLEQKIIFLSSRRSLLLAVTTALKELLKPLQWCHLHVPMVPVSLIADLLQYPAPFLLGLDSSGSADIVRDLPGDVTLVDLDVGRVILGVADELRPGILAMAQQVGTTFGQRTDPITWCCDDVLHKTTTKVGFAALKDCCHEFCLELVSNTTACCYKVDDTILFDEASFECVFDDTLKDTFLRSQAMNVYIGTREHKEMRC